MLVFYGTVIGLVLFACGFLGILVWQIGFNRYLLGTVGVFLLVLVLGYCVNPDMLSWYHSIRHEQDLKHAKHILHDPKQFKQLLQHLEQRVKTAPKDFKAWFLLGRLYAQMDNWDKAHDALFQAHRLQPNHLKTSLFYVETVWHTQNGLTDYARGILQAILVKEPQQPDALVMLAADAKYHHCYAQALSYLNQLISMIPKESPMYQDIYQEIVHARQHTHEKCLIK